MQPSFVTAVEEKTDGDAKVEKVSRELWKRIWSKDQDISQLASLAEVLYTQTLYHISVVCLCVCCVYKSADRKSVV